MAVMTSSGTVAISLGATCRKVGPDRKIGGIFGVLIVDGVLSTSSAFVSKLYVVVKEDELFLLMIFVPGWGEFGTDLFDVGVGFVLFLVVTIVLFGGHMLEADWFGLFDFLTAD